MIKKHLLASTALIAGSLLAINAQAGDAEFYGQVNKALMWADDDASNSDRLRVVDNDLSSTRFGFRGEQAIGNGLTASFLLEGEFSSSPNDTSRAMSAGLGDTGSDLAGSFTERHARVGLSGNFGSVFMGRTSSATDGITEIDLGSVSDVMSSDLNAFGGGVSSFGSAYGNLEGFDDQNNADRVNLVRYDTPIYNGFQGSVAFANGGDVDAAVRYGAKFGGTEVKAGIGYAKFNSALLADAEQWSGSISAKHDSGLNGTVAYGTQDIDGTNVDPEFWYAKVGYDMGNWGFAVDYGTAEDFSVDDAKAWGLGAQYNFGNGVSAAVLYRDLDVDASGDGKVAVANMRVKF